MSKSQKTTFDHARHKTHGDTSPQKVLNQDIINNIEEQFRTWRDDDGGEYITTLQLLQQNKAPLLKLGAGVLFMLGAAAFAYNVIQDNNGDTKTMAKTKTTVVAPK